MAFTVSRSNHSSGDLRQVIMSCTADAATASIESGLSKIIGFAFSPVSMTSSSSSTIYTNTLAAGTAAAGYVAVTNVTSGDEFMLIVYGK